MTYWSFYSVSILSISAIRKDHGSHRRRWRNYCSLHHSIRRDLSWSSRRSSSDWRCGSLYQDGRMSSFDSVSLDKQSRQRTADEKRGLTCLSFPSFFFFFLQSWHCLCSIFVLLVYPFFNSTQPFTHILFRLTLRTSMDTPFFFPSSLLLSSHHLPTQTMADYSTPQRTPYVCLNQTFLVDSSYEISKELGQGAYGCVASATHKRTGESVAIKKITNVFSKRILTKRALREIKWVESQAERREIQRWQDWKHDKQIE